MEWGWILLGVGLAAAYVALWWAWRSHVRGRDDIVRTTILSRNFIGGNGAFLYGMLRWLRLRAAHEADARLQMLRRDQTMNDPLAWQLRRDLDATKQSKPPAGAGS